MFERLTRRIRQTRALRDDDFVTVRFVLFDFDFRFSIRIDDDLLQVDNDSNGGGFATLIEWEQIICHEIDLKLSFVFFSVMKMSISMN